jgi:hypothetical protein
MKDYFYGKIRIMKDYFYGKITSIEPYFYDFMRTLGYTIIFFLLKGVVLLTYVEFFMK